MRAAIAARPATAPTAPVAPPPAPSPLPVQHVDVITLNAIRQRTGERLAESWRTIPHVFQAIEVDFTAVDRVRRKHKEAFQKAHGFSLTYLPFIARATCLAIAAFPQVNARFDGKALTLSRDINLGIAVDLDHNGLIVPVVRDAGDLTLIGLAKAIRRQIDKAKAGKLSPDDLSGGTYSISNNGAFGTTFHRADHQCAAGRHSLDRRDPPEACGSVDARGRLRRAAHDRHDRAEFRSPCLRRRLFGRVPLAA